MNNAEIQRVIDRNEKAFTFTSSQPAEQVLTSSASQVVTEHATQTAHRVLSCTVTVGGVKNPRVFEADGTRDGVKTGTREGTRTGDRAGTLTAPWSASIDAKARKTGQWTGWNIKRSPSRRSRDARRSSPSTLRPTATRRSPATTPTATSSGPAGSPSPAPTRPTASATTTARRSPT